MATQRDHEVVHKVVERFDKSSAYKQPYMTQWEKDLRQWEGILDNLKKLKALGMSHLYIPYSFTLTEWMIENIITKIDLLHPIVKLNPKMDTPVAVALRNEELFDYQLHWNTHDDIEDAIRQLIMHGTGVLFVSWRPDKWNHEGLVIEWVDIRDFYPDAKARNWAEAEWVIWRSERSLDYLLEKEKQGYYTNISKLKKKLQSVNITPSSKVETAIGKGIKRTPEGEFVIELLQCWEKYSKKWYVVAGREFLIKEQNNPFKHEQMPFAMVGLYRRPGVMYAKGMLEVLSDQQDELNAMRNLRRDQEKLTVKRLLKVLKSAHIDRNQLERWLTGGIIEVTTQNDIQSEQFLPLPQEAYAAPQELKIEMQDATGTQEYSRGITPPRKELATTMLLLQRAAEPRVGYVLRAVGKLLCQVARMAVSNNQQFMIGEIPASIFAPGKDIGISLRAEDLAGSFDFIPQLHLAVMNRAEREQKALLLYRELAKDPQVNPQKRLTYLLDCFEIPDPEEWYVPQPVVQPGMPQGMPQEGMELPERVSIPGEGFPTGMPTPEMAAEVTAQLAALREQAGV